MCFLHLEISSALDSVSGKGIATTSSTTALMISTMPGNLNVNEQRGKVFSLSCVVLEEKKILNAKTELANTSFCHASHFHSLILYDSVPHRFTSSPL